MIFLQKVEMAMHANVRNAHDLPAPKFQITDGINRVIDINTGEDRAFKIYADCVRYLRRGVDLDCVLDAAVAHSTQRDDELVEKSPGTYTMGDDTYLCGNLAAATIEKLTKTK